LRAELPRILAAPSDVLSPRMVHLIENLAGDWRRRGGPGCLNRFYASISGVSAGVRLPCGGAAA
jgi:hypothetical protein